MSNYLAGRIKKARFGLRAKVAKANRPKFIVGYDSEADTTGDGRPMLFQFSLPNSKEEDTLLYEIPADKKHAGLRCFVEFIDKYCTSPSIEYLIYGFNNQYELTQLFHDLPDTVKAEADFMIRGISTADGVKYNWTIEVLNYKRHIIIFRKGKIRVDFLDAMAFYNTSLDKAAKMLGLGAKYESDNLDRSTFTRELLKDEEFLTYSKRDAYITRLIGEYIQQQHAAQGISTTISAPHFAATVFKTHFLTVGTSASTEDIEQAGLYSYHGGKNGFYLDGPAEFASIFQYDITSAYPEAMRQLPDIEQSGWKHLTKYVPGIHGLYNITVDYSRCHYKSVQNHDGSWTRDGLVDHIWITSYELDELFAYGEINNVYKITGYQMIGPSGGALANYVDKFFLVKKHTVGPERETAKLLLNSLYGKFFQKQPVGSVGNYDIDGERWVTSNPDRTFDYEAGGLYNPAVASLITGFVRAKIHRLEHKYDSVMTSTDGIFANNPPDASEIGKELGQLTATEGRLRIWRERLYIFDYVESDGKPKRKMALHGFHAGADELEKIPLARGVYEYYGRQLVTLKMSTTKLRGLEHGAGEILLLNYKLKV